MKDPTTLRRGGKTSMAAACRSTITCAKRLRRSCSCWVTIDVCLDHPQAPVGDVVKTRADELRLGLDKVVASYILPMNMVWWRTDAAGRYVECLVREYVDPADRMDYDKNGNAIDPDDPGDIGETWRRTYVRWRLWRINESILYNFDGSEVLDRMPHNFGRVPIVRLIDQKKHRTRTVGKSRYEAIAEYQREYYNRDSELILSDTLQAHPFLSGPEDLLQGRQHSLGWPRLSAADEEKYRRVAPIEGFEYVSPPKDPAESLRRNKEDLVDMKDRRACLIKPAGTSSSGTVGQSGISETARRAHRSQVPDVDRQVLRASRAVPRRIRLDCTPRAAP